MVSIIENNLSVANVCKKSKEHDLEQKIDLEIKMREGTTKLLAACKHQSQSLEAAKSLLTSNERMTAYMSELQRRRKELPANRGINSRMTSRGQVSLSDLRIPLIWRDSDHFKNKGDHRRFAVFCLARIGTEIFDTTLLYPIDRSHTDLTFTDALLFNNIAPDFEFRLEIYSHILQDDLTMASTPRRIKRTIHSSISRTVGKKLAASLKDELGFGKIGPRFELMASARLTLDDVDEAVRTYDLQLETIDTRSHQLPLFGNFCCRLAAQPQNFTKEAFSGDLNVCLRDEKVWQPVWGRLSGFKFDMWRLKGDFDNGLKPILTLPVDKNTLVKPLSGNRGLCILRKNENNQEEVALRLETRDSNEQQQKFLCACNQTANDHSRWGRAAAKCMDVSLPGGASNATSDSTFNRHLSATRCHGSLYDQTPLIEAIAPLTRSVKKPSVQEIFGISAGKSASTSVRN